MQHCFYLGDEIFAESENNLLKALETLKVSGVDCGLELRNDKYPLFSLESMNKIDRLIQRNRLDMNSSFKEVL